MAEVGDPENWSGPRAVMVHDECEMSATDYYGIHH